VPSFPLPFLLVVGGLIKVLIEAKNIGAMNGIRMGGDLYISHLLFVYDILLFCNGSRRDALKLKETMELYCMATTMIVNVGKPIIFFMGINDEDRRMNLHMFPCKEVEFHCSINYIGFYLKPSDYTKC
jgi:hypothetical protein